jgi:phage-related protein
MGEAVESATEGLKNENSVLVDNAGVTKNVAKMWEEYAASIGTTANNLTQQQKIQAEVNGILTESRFQAGDAAKVAGTLSGQLAQLSVNFNNLKVAVGNALKPIVQSFLPVINVAIATLTRFANALASVVSVLFGNATSGTVEATQQVADGYNSAAEGAENLAKSTKEAGKAAKKYLAGFDELTKIGDSSGGSGSSGATAGGTTSVSVPVVADAKMQDNISPKVQAVVDRIKEMFQSLGTWFVTAYQPAISAWGDAFGSLGPAVEKTGSRISTAWKKLQKKTLAPFGSYIVKEFVPDIANTFTTTFVPIFTDVAHAALEIYATDFDNVALLVEEYCGHLRAAFDGVKTVFSDMCASITSNWNEYGGNLLQGFIDFRESLWEIWWNIYDNIIDPVITAVGDKLGWLWDAHLKPLWDSIVEFVLSVSENILALWNGFLQPIIDWVISVLAPAVTNVVTIIVDAVAIAIGFIADVISSILTFLDGLIQFIVGIFTLDWDKAWNGVVKVFESIFGLIGGIVKGVVNDAIWIFNALISAIYSVVAGIVNGLGGIVEAAGD